jgi:DNA topoisomerase VI subunit B
LKKASGRLLDKVIAALVRDLNNMTEIPRSSADIEEIMHTRGINMRHLGKLANETTRNYMREFLIREIVSRSSKAIIKDGLSFLRNEPNGFSQIDVKKCVLYYLNQIFTKENR